MNLLKTHENNKFFFFYLKKLILLKFHYKIAFEQTRSFMNIFSKFFKYCFYLGHVAQWTRACGYEPQSRGFESLLAQKMHLFMSSKSSQK